jgi:hypothetical protein
VEDASHSRTSSVGPRPKDGLISVGVVPEEIDLGEDWFQTHPLDNVSIQTFDDIILVENKQRN